MKHNLILPFLLFAAMAFGQTNTLTVLSTVCKNLDKDGSTNSALRPTYSTMCNTSGRPITPGQTLSREGCVDLPDECMVRLLYNGGVIVLDKKGTTSLADITGGTARSSGIGYMNRFLRYIANAIDHTKDEKQLIENHRAHMETVRAAIKGFGTRDFDIHTNGTMEGNMSTMNITFQWEGKDGEDYLFTLLRKRDNMDLLRRRVQTPSLSLVPGLVSLDEGETYIWQVSTPKDADRVARHSQPREFVFKANEISDITSMLASQPDYLQGAEHEKTLMYTFALEEAGYRYDAAAMYIAAIDAYPGNLLVRRAAADFFMRMDMLDQARGLLSEE
jgi:hypothetical protein